MKNSEFKRCWWCGDDPLYQSYHDNEWGVPVHDDRDLFEFLCLEGAQAGLSWITILRKREHYRLVFDDFDAEKIVRYDDKKIASLLGDAGIVRNRLKVNGFVKNARAYLALLDEGMSLDSHLWSFVDFFATQWEVHIQLFCCASFPPALAAALSSCVPCRIPSLQIWLLPPNHSMTRMPTESRRM